MFELATLSEEFVATRARRRRGHLVRGPVDSLRELDPVRITEIADGNRTGKVEYALVTHIEPIATPFGQWHLVSFELRDISSDSMRALRGIPTPVPAE